MKDKLFYVFLIIWLLNVLITGPFNLINLILLGVFIGIIAGKQKTGSYSLWKLIVGIGIAFCNVLITLAIIFHLIKL